MSEDKGKKNTESKFALHVSDVDNTLFETIVGGSALFVFLLTWIGSLGTPVLVATSVLHEEYISLAAVVAATLVAYLPWKKGYIANLVSNFARFNNKYYKKCTVVFESKESLPTLDKEKRPNLYAFHPHGAFCMGWSVLFCSKIMNDGLVRFVFSPVLYASPLFRLWCRLTGRPGSAKKGVMIGYMKERKDGKRRDHLALPPGGFEEATISCMGKDRVYIKKRVGFIKLALQHGYNVVPVYTFGENNTYYNVQGLWKLRLWLNSLGFPAIAIFGSWLFPLIPKRDPLGIKVVVADALVLPKISNPTREEVKLWHDKYIAALVRLFDEHKEEYYGPEFAKTAKLELW